MRRSATSWVRRLLVAGVLATPLALAGCISVTRESPPPTTTIVVPPGSTAVCSNGTAPPC